MKLKTNFVIREVVDMYVAVAIGSGEDDFNGVIRLNEPGKRTLELIMEGNEPDAIVTALLNEYDATEDQIRQQVNSVINTLREQDLIEQ